MTSKKIIFFFSMICNVYSLSGDFVFGTATAAYQIEGGYNDGGKGQSIWDYFTSFNGTVNKNDNGNLADDFYHRYEEDIHLMKKMGLKHLRISISWPRIFPKDDYEAPNEEGVEFYNRVINTLLENGIEPWVTLYHWDLPQVYNDLSEKGTWLNENIPHKFNKYADYCFKTFGDRVKYWLTMNEIQSFVVLGYETGLHAPGRCSQEFNPNCEKIGGGGDSSVEPYIAAHHALISHALAVKTYREKYQKAQNGQIGMTINSDFILPFNSSNTLDVEAANIQMAFSFGWFADPIVFGDYPEEMKKLISGNRLPSFNDTMKEILRNSSDFLGLNYYTSSYGKWNPEKGKSYTSDSQTIKTFVNASGHILGPQADSEWLVVYPEGLYGKLKWINDRYNNRETDFNFSIFIFENGVSVPNENKISLDEAVNDIFRIDYIKNHIDQVRRASDEKIPVKGYFLWSFLDNFEWIDGYEIRFGIVYVDYKNNLKRIVKNSGWFYSDLVKKENKKQIINKFLDVKERLD